MRKTPLSLAEFRAQVSAHTHFRLKYDEPLKSLSVNLLFDRVHICFGGNDYIAFQGADMSAVVTHIQRVEKCRGEWGTTYYLRCFDYSAEVPAEIVYTLEAM